MNLKLVHQVTQYFCYNTSVTTTEVAEGESHLVISNMTSLSMQEGKDANGSIPNEPNVQITFLELDQQTCNQKIMNLEDKIYLPLNLISDCM